MKEKKSNNHAIIIIIVVIIIIIIIGIAIGIYFYKRHRKHNTPKNSPNSSNNNNNSPPNNPPDNPPNNPPNNPLSCGTWSAFPSTTNFTIQGNTGCVNISSDNSIIISPSCTPSIEQNSGNVWIMYNNGFENIASKIMISPSGNGLIGTQSTTAQWTYCPNSKMIMNSNNQCWKTNNQNIELITCPTISENVTSNMQWTFNVISPNLPSNNFNIQNSSGQCLLPNDNSTVIIDTCGSPAWTNNNGYITSIQYQTILSTTGEKVIMAKEPDPLYNQWIYNPTTQTLGTMQTNKCLFQYPVEDNGNTIPFFGTCSPGYIYAPFMNQPEYVYPEKWTFS